MQKSKIHIHATTANAWFCLFVKQATGVTHIHLGNCGHMYDGQAHNNCSYEDCDYDKGRTN